MILLYATYLFYLVALLGTCLYAIRRGGRTERQATVALLIGVLATQVAYQFGNDWRSPEYGIMAVDAALFVAFVVIAYGSDRFWPIWIAAAQLVGTITHLAVVVHPNVVTELYRMTQPFWVFPILAGIAWGTFSRTRTASRSG
jgi:hypothetical protein